MQETWVQSLGWEDLPGEGNGNPLQYSCLENSMDGKAWEATVHGVAKSRTHLSNFSSHSSTSYVVCAKSFSHVQLFGTLWTVIHQAPLSRGVLQARILE